MSRNETLGVAHTVEDQLRLAERNSGINRPIVTFLGVCGQIVQLEERLSGWASERLAR